MELRYLVWAGAGLIVILSIALAAIGVRRRIARGRPAKFGLGIGLVDVIEGVTGREMSPRAQGRVFATAMGLAILVVVIGVIVILIRSGSQP